MGRIKISLVLSMALMIIAIDAHDAYGEPVIVDLQLQQLVDISASVEENPDGEFSLQRDAWAFAFSSDDVKAAIADPNFNGMCVQFIYWSGSTQQEIVVDWKLVNDAASAEEVSDAITNFVRPFDDGGTEIDDAILFAIDQLNNQDAECQGITKIMDISGDGTGNAAATSAARDAALDAGIDSINGLAIQGANVQTFYENNVQAGDGSFTLFASTFNALAAAAEQKILDEIMFAIDNNQVIGGQIISINSVSLLVAGLESMTIWMAPVLAGAAGVTALYLKSRKN
jgi:hypothetical protein